ncbi:hypothetical protein K1719_034200 [Acacia pycnantha]|nr:hypothetical protein K1719_034200 [Acacia pycnantha]
MLRLCSFSKPSSSAFNSQMASPLASHSSRTSLGTPATSMKGAESYVMGLLLRERIVFLGSDIDDLVADAIIGRQFLDTQDPKKISDSSLIRLVAIPVEVLERYESIMGVAM